MYAHTLAGHGPEEWEPLQFHLQRVSRLAAEFAAAFGAGDWGAVIGRWHDLGKASLKFQQYLLATCDSNAGENEQRADRVDHSTFGAQHSARLVRGYRGQLLAFCIAGHHAGLADAFSDDETTRRSTLAARLEKPVEPVEVPPEEIVAPVLEYPFQVSTAKDLAAFQLAFFGRMLFSTLIDADRLATEEFCNKETAAERNIDKPGIDVLNAQLTAFLADKQREAKPTPVNVLRTRVLADCIAAAGSEPGFFSLNVPTGGGKTLSSLAFALEHARRHARRRVVVAIPFTSIIEQSADVYREALGPLAATALVEHHGSVEPTKMTRQNQLACENWDAPLIVTTNVQLYESLFAARTTPCRKLHRLAHSVIVLDEAQTLPVELLEPTLMALQELVEHYGCTVVLCTATQPALEWRSREFEIGLKNVRPIISDVRGLFAALKRVEVTRLGRLHDDELVGRLAEESSVLCIVNTRSHAARLYDALVARLASSAGCFHLSAMMCPQHRRETLATIRQQLEDRTLPCRVISTQLVEAGVDVDFPVVFRAPAGFDSLAQAAGRCNREGTLTSHGRPSMGRVYVFDSETKPPPGLLRAAAECATELAPGFPDPLAPEAIEAYFRSFYWSQSHCWDKRDVLTFLRDDFTDRQLRSRLRFRTAAERYRIILNEERSLLVPYDANACRLRARFLRGDDDFALRRQAQPYTIAVREQIYRTLAENNAVIETDSGFLLLVNQNAYSPEKGLLLEAVGMDPDISIF